MSKADAKDFISDFLKGAGANINGPKAWDPQVHDERVYNRVMTKGTLGAGESYMEGWWDCDQLDELVARLVGPASPIYKLGKSVAAKQFLRATLRNPQSIWRAKKDVAGVYDIGNDLYEAMLGPSMAYTCGYWKNAKNLDEAQEAKYDLICRKLDLKPGMTMLDIGCGWGNLLDHAMKKYGVKGTGLTLSKEQKSYANEHFPKVKVEIADYRHVSGQNFDRITTVGMIEHVGPKNYRAFFKKVNELLKDDGIYLLHTIGTDNKSHRMSDAWLSKYIFPGSHLPSVKQLATAFEGLFLLEDWHNFGAYYDKTLLAWYKNFERAWPKLRPKYGDKFYRMWRYYLLTCAGLFRARRTNLWQIVLSKAGQPGGYQSHR